MIYRLLSGPCVHISVHNINVQAAHGADDIGAHVPDSRGHSPATVLVPPPPYHTTGPVVGGWRGKNKPYFDNVSLIDSDSSQVSFSFPNLPKALIMLRLGSGLSFMRQPLWMELYHLIHRYTSVTQIYLCTTQGQNKKIVVFRYHDQKKIG